MSLTVPRRSFSQFPSPLGLGYKGVGQAAVEYFVVFPELNTVLRVYGCLYCPGEPERKYNDVTRVYVNCVPS
jgi:hypothetical protein